MQALATAATAGPPPTAAVADWIARISAVLPQEAARAPAPPAACAVATTADEAIAAHERRAAPPATSAQPVPFPEGTYTTTTTAADMRAGGQLGDDWDQDIAWTFTFAEGRVHEVQDPALPAQPPCDGTYGVDGDLLRIAWTDACGIAPETTRWSYLDGQLTFAVVDVPDSASRVIYTAHPWRKAD